MNGAPTGDATNRPTPRPHPSTRNATNHMCRSGTGRHEWRPHGRRHKPTTTKQHSTTRKRRGATCDARITDAVPQTNRRPARIRRRTTRPTTCAVPAPGVMNDAPTGDATNRPPRNNVQPTPRPHPPTRNATDHMCRSGTGRHEWRPHGRRHKPTAAKQHSTTRKRRGATCDAQMTDAKQHSTARKRRGATCDTQITATMPRTGRRPARIRRRATRPTTCAVPAPGVMNGAPTGYATNQPTKNCKPTATNVGAPLVTPE